jgi:glycosyltransferase involved in cell wall biosynthesis
LVVNLSHPEGWIETFGLTLLEAMACGIPVVSPTVGGCVEVVENDRGGWHIASRDTDALARLVCRLRDDRDVWLCAARAARRSALRFAPERFRQHLNDALPTPR